MSLHWGGSTQVAERMPSMATTTVMDASTTSTGAVGVRSGQATGVGHTTTRTPKTSYAAVVQYSSKGFSPSVVHITAGQVVHFVNKSSLSMRVHTVTQGPREYVGLDEQQVVGTGGTYDFLFNEPGNWDYFNLEGNSNSLGTVVVSSQ